MADFADSSAATLDVELLAPIAAGRLSPALPAGEQLLESNYRGCLPPSLQAVMVLRSPRSTTICSVPASLPFGL